MASQTQSPRVRRQLAPIIVQLRDKDAEAADHIGRPLAKQVSTELRKVEE